MGNKRKKRNINIIYVIILVLLFVLYLIFGLIFAYLLFCSKVNIVPYSIPSTQNYCTNFSTFSTGYPFDQTSLVTILFWPWI